MSADPKVWRVRSPGDLSVEMAEISAGDVRRAVEISKRAFRGWRHESLEARKAALALCRERLKAKRDDLARLMVAEVGKPLREARLEVAAVIAKFDLAFADADECLPHRRVADGPHPAMVRLRARGPAAVVAPSIFPSILGMARRSLTCLPGIPWFSSHLHWRRTLAEPMRRKCRPSCPRVCLSWFKAGA